MTLRGWQDDDESTDVRTRDLAARQKAIMDGTAKPWGNLGKPYEPTVNRYLLAHDHPGLSDDRQRIQMMGERVGMDVYRQHEIPRRTDWLRVAEMTVLILAVCAASVAFIAGVALFIISLF